MKAKPKIRSVTVKVAETRLNERQIAAISSDHFGAIRDCPDLVTEWVVDFIDFTDPDTKKRVYAAFCIMSFQRALMAYEIPVTD